MTRSVYRAGSVSFRGPVVPIVLGLGSVQASLGRERFWNLLVRAHPRQHVRDCRGFFHRELARRSGLRWPATRR